MSGDVCSDGNTRGKIAVQELPFILGVAGLVAGAGALAGSWSYESAFIPMYSASTILAVITLHAKAMNWCGQSLQADTDRTGGDE